MWQEGEEPALLTTYWWHLQIPFPQRTGSVQCQASGPRAETALRIPDMERVQVLPQEGNKHGTGESLTVPSPPQNYVLPRRGAAALHSKARRTMSCFLWDVVFVRVFDLVWTQYLGLTVVAFSLCNCISTKEGKNM